MEVEIKLLLQDDEADRLRSGLGPPLRSIHQLNRYFDDPGRSLGRSGWALRIRESTGNSGASTVTLTVKHAGHEEDGFSVRPEFEATLASAGLTPAQVLAVARELVPGRDPLASVTRILELGRLVNHREVWELGGQFLIELDHTEWPDGSTSDELELELGEAADALSAQMALRGLLERHRIPWRVGHESKLARLVRML